jgi:hypothetical protein
MGDLRKMAKEILDEKEEVKLANLPPIMNGIDTNTIIKGGIDAKYGIPTDASTLQDLIEFKEMNFADANIFKAIYRKGSCDHSSKERDSKKILWFAARESKRLKIQDEANEFITRFNQGEKLQDLIQEYSIIKIK